MDETEKYIRALIQQQGITINERTEELFREFSSTPENINNVQEIRLLQETMTKSWQLIARRDEINSLQVALPNAIAGKPYKVEFQFSSYGLDDIVSYELTGFDESGLAYDSKTSIIEGIPEKSGDIPLNFRYNFDGEPEDAPANNKKITIIVNPDPKSLWKNIPSDASDIYAKADDTTEIGTFLGRKIVASSKRGRSHANKGSFRDDDYSYEELSNGWGIIAISDGAGSASYSRKGSAVACNAVIQYFKENFTDSDSSLLDEAITIHSTDTSIKSKLQDIAFPHLSTAARKAHSDIEAIASTLGASVADFHATLAFALIKQFDDGYAFLSFGVGDCPMVLVDKSFEWVKPLNTLDVGEYGGGTRFITMPEIFTNEIFESRFNFEFCLGFPYFVLMSDGIYDPKFEVEANLAKPEKWKVFFDDLKGKNSEAIVVPLDEINRDNAQKLSDWMDFWSPGNHDDRTLIIVL